VFKTEMITTTRLSEISYNLRFVLTAFGINISFRSWYLNKAEVKFVTKTISVNVFSVLSYVNPTVQIIVTIGGCFNVDSS